MKVLFLAVILTSICLATTSCSCGTVDDYGETCREEEEKNAAENRDRDLDNRICYDQGKVDACIKEQESTALPERINIQKYCQEKHSYNCK